ncbi:MAG: TonB-dependent receptor [Blastocatellia bacterium]
MAKPRVSWFTRVSYNFLVHLISAASLLLLVALGVSAQTLTGIVVDGNGAPIAGASVSITRTNSNARTITNSEGRFSIAVQITNGSRLTVKAGSFATFERQLANDGVRDFFIVLQPANLSADVTIVVTRAETRLGETPASVVVLTRDALDSTAAQTVDDSLRQIAGFTLFRRSSSKTANPTTQGANLRGVSGSGASRAAVLFDGLSLNDAFGGWTYWSRVPQIAVEQAELLRGGASSLYGTGGLSGAVNLVPLKNGDDAPMLNIRSSVGSQNTYDGGLFTSFAKSGLAIDLAAETFQTGGYIPTAENERGLADTRVNSRHYNGIFTIERRFRAKGSPPVLEGVADASADGVVNGRIFARGSLFSERRDNGTSLTSNRTYFRQAAAGGDYSNTKLGDFQLRAFLETQVYDQTFSAISADRNAESLSRIQRVPSQVRGGSLFWTRPVETHVISASFETREVRGFSDEIGFTNSRPTSQSGSGGTERTYAFLVQDIWNISKKLNLNLGVRFDNWSNIDARSTTRTLATNAVSVLSFPDRSQNTFSPRIGVLYQLTQSISLYGAFSRSFRAPTLNELYRGFRVGNVVTQANANLTAERASTFEGGVSFTGKWLNIRGNTFVTEVSDPVVSVTLSTTPTLITRQRQNVGKTRTFGIELDFELFVRSDLKFSASYLLADSRVTEFAVSPPLVGKFLPQIAKQQLNFQINYRPRSRFSFGIQSRISDAQFEDDLNTLRLRPYFKMDATAAFRINKKFQVFAAAENLFNSRYDIGLTPNRTVAAPAFVRVGLRLNLGKR